MTITVNLDFGKREIENFQELVRTIHGTVLQLGREIAVKALESMDEQLLGSRDASRYRSKGFQQTCIKTILGPVEFKRRVYVDTAAVEGQHCVHLLDEALELHQVGLVTEDVCKMAATAACETTYRAAAKTITETTGLMQLFLGAHTPCRFARSGRGDSSLCTIPSRPVWRIPTREYRSFASFSMSSVRGPGR